VARLPLQLRSSRGWLLVFIVLLVGVPLGPRAAAQTAWTTVGEMPLARGQTVAVAEGGKIYVLTGSAPGQDATGLLQAFDPERGTWEDLATMPDVASHAGAAVVDGSIYVVGGFVANVHAGAMDRVFRYDIAADAWEALAPLRVPRGSPAVVALDGRIHAVSGRNGDGLVGAHEVYDPATDRWSEAAPLPVPRDHKGIGVAGGRIHVFGGRTGGSSENTDRHDIYDPATNTWTVAPPLPTPRSGGAAFQLDGLLAFAGGECRRSGPSPTFAEVEAWDPRTGSWITLPPLPQGRHAFAAATVHGAAYVIGGRTGCGGSGATLEILSLEGV
jgi:N-acetylneuraminic acid mutarotase